MEAQGEVNINMSVIKLASCVYVYMCVLVSVCGSTSRVKSEKKDEDLGAI